MCAIECMTYTTDKFKVVKLANKVFSAVLPRYCKLNSE